MSSLGQRFTQQLDLSLPLKCSTLAVTQPSLFTNPSSARLTQLPLARSDLTWRSRCGMLTPCNVVSEERAPKCTTSQPGLILIFTEAKTPHLIYIYYIYIRSIFHLVWFIYVYRTCSLTHCWLWLTYWRITGRWLNHKTVRSWLVISFQSLNRDLRCARHAPFIYN